VSLGLDKLDRRMHARPADSRSTGGFTLDRRGPGAHVSDM